MLTSDKLHELAVKKQTTDLNIRREYAQHLFLSYFYQQPKAETVFFKGGTALRFLYNSPRFSEDLDFSSLDEDITLLENLIQNTLAEIEREGIGTNIIESKKTSGGYLSIISLFIGESKINLQIEISFRDREIKGEVLTVIGDFIPSYTVVSLLAKQIVLQKICALFSRKKTRDFYDLYFLLRANLLPLEEKSLLLQMLTELQKTDISFRKELEQFLPRSHWLLIKDFKFTLEKEIRKFILTSAKN